MAAAIARTAVWGKPSKRSRLDAESRHRMFVIAVTAVRETLPLQQSYSARANFHQNGRLQRPAAWSWLRGPLDRYVARQCAELVGRAGRPDRQSINDQISMLLFIGHSFDRGFLYLGAGPTLSLTQTYLNGVTGFADINGTHTQITGTPTNLSSSGVGLGRRAATGRDLLPRPDMVSRLQLHLQHDGEPNRQL